MTNWPGHTGPERGRHDQPGGQPASGQQPPPPPPATGSYRQPWGSPPSTPPQPTAPPEGHQPSWNQSPQWGAPAQPWAQPQQGAPTGWQDPAAGAPAQPWAQPQQGPPTGWQNPAPTLGVPPQKSRKGLIIALAAVVVIAIVGFVGFRVVSGEGVAGIGGTQALSPKETVQQYLDALAAGDAEKALSFGASQPANSDLLTNDILSKQNAKLPLTNIRVLDADTTTESIGISRVHVAVNFGTVVDDVELPLKKNGDGQWKLENAVIKLDAPPGGGSMKSLDTVTVFGKNFKSGSLYLFPGYMEVGSTNPNLTVTADPILLKGLAAYSSSYLDAKVELSDMGSQAIQQQLSEAFAKCQSSSLLNPPGCPTKVSAYDAADAVDGTVQWGKADLSGVTVGQLSPYDMTVSLSGKATMSLAYQLRDGGMQRGDASSYVNAEVDMSVSPPRIDWR